MVSLAIKLATATQYTQLNIGLSATLDPLRIASTAAFGSGDAALWHWEFGQLGNSNARCLRSDRAFHSQADPRVSDFAAGLNNNRKAPVWTFTFGASCSRVFRDGRCVAAVPSHLDSVALPADGAQLYLFVVHTSENINRRSMAAFARRSVVAPLTSRVAFGHRYAPLLARQIWDRRRDDVVGGAVAQKILCVSTRCAHCAGPLTDLLAHDAFLWTLHGRVPAQVVPKACCCCNAQVHPQWISGRASSHDFGSCSRTGPGRPRRQVRLALRRVPLDAPTHLSGMSTSMTTSLTCMPDCTSPVHYQQRPSRGPWCLAPRVCRHRVLLQEATCGVRMNCGWRALPSCVSTVPVAFRKSLLIATPIPRGIWLSLAAMRMMQHQSTKPFWLACCLCLWKSTRMPSSVIMSSSAPKPAHQCCLWMQIGSWPTQGAPSLWLPSLCVGRTSRFRNFATGAVSTA